MKNAQNPLSNKKYFKDQKPPDLNQLRQTKKKFTVLTFLPQGTLLFLVIQMDIL